jgi:hypothetical protein
MTSFKSLLTSRASALRYAYNPELGITAPFQDVLDRWDELTRAGRRVVVIGNSDAHGTEFRHGRLRRVIFPYEFLFRQVNTHLLIEGGLSGEYERDRGLVLEALRRGHCFVAYDGAAPARGFRFSGTTERGTVIMGDEVSNRSGITLQVGAPAAASLRLLRDGREMQRWEGQTHASLTVPAGEAGVFRVEAHIGFKGQTRGWIYSNPIYVTRG